MFHYAIHNISKSYFIVNVKQDYCLVFTGNISLTI